MRAHIKVYIQLFFACRRPVGVTGSPVIEDSNHTDKQWKNKPPNLAPFLTATPPFHNKRQLSSIVYINIYIDVNIDIYL